MLEQLALHVQILLAIVGGVSILVCMLLLAAVVLLRHTRVMMMAHVTLLLSVKRANFASYIVFVYFMRGNVKERVSSFSIIFLLSLFRRRERESREERHQVPVSCRSTTFFPMAINIVFTLFKVGFLLHIKFSTLLVKTA